MHFLELPEELIALCCKHIDLFTARALRLTCKRMTPIATKNLLSHVHLLPTTESAKKARAILTNDNLMPLVTVVSIKASLGDVIPDIWPVWDMPDDWRKDRPEYADETKHGLETNGVLSSAFKTMLNNIGLFENLRRVELKFDWQVRGLASWDDDGNHRERTEYREPFLKNFFLALNHPEHPASKVHSLSICNLHDLSNHRTLRSEDFKAVLSRIDNLELAIATEELKAGPEREIECPERHQFFGTDLIDLWLAPVQHNLVNLKLYSNCYWGYLPKCDLRKLRFPRLKGLAFGRMTFTHDWQLDWIISHGQTLESLTLYDCPIVHDAKVAQATDSERYVKLQDGTVEWDLDNVTTWSYGSRWHDYLHKMTLGLPRLQHFGMAHHPWGHDYDESNATPAFHDTERSAFETSASLPALLQGGRYFVFDWAVQWVGPGGGYYGVYSDCTEKITELELQYECGGGIDELPLYPDCWDRDQEALDVFMAGVDRQRARIQSV
jgi:hypothetical protein